MISIFGWKSDFLQTCPKSKISKVPQTGDLALQESFTVQDTPGSDAHFSKWPDIKVFLAGFTNEATCQISKIPATSPSKLNGMLDPFSLRSAPVFWGRPKLAYLYKFWYCPIWIGLLDVFSAEHMCKNETLRTNAGPSVKIPVHISPFWALRFSVLE